MSGGVAGYKVLEGRDPLDSLIDDLQQMTATALDREAIEIASAMAHLLLHAEAAKRLHALIQAELVAIVARADGELYISEVELAGCHQLKFTHKPEPDGYRLTVERMEGSRDQA